MGEKAHTRRHTCTPTLDHYALQPHGEDGAVSVSSSIDGGKGVCERVSPALRGTVFLRPSSVSRPERCTLYFLCSHHRPLLPWRRWEGGTRGGPGLLPPGQRIELQSPGPSTQTSPDPKEPDCPPLPHLVPGFCGELRNSWLHFLRQSSPQLPSGDGLCDLMRESTHTQVYPLSLPISQVPDLRHQRDQSAAEPGRWSDHRVDFHRPRGLHR